MRSRMAVGLLVVCAAAHAQVAPSFDVVSVKLSARPVGPDYNNRISYTATGVTARNVTLKRLIAEAWRLQQHQVSGGPNFLGTAEYDVDARTSAPVTPQQMSPMLQAMLADRFRLSIHKDTKEMKVYWLLADKGGAKIQPTPPDAPPVHGFRGDIQEFANMLAIKLTMPEATDPTKPVMAMGTPTPVVNKTGLTGSYDLAYDFKPELGVDGLVQWQRVLQPLGLKLESRKDNVEMVVVDHVERQPTGN